MAGKEGFRAFLPSVTALAVREVRGYRFLGAILGSPAGGALALSARHPGGRADPERAEHALVRHNARPRAHDGQRPAYLMHMDDKDIMARISDLIDTEHELRGQLARGELSSEQERDRLRSAEEALDQCWDLLRQRRARRQYGENPDAAQARPVDEVQGYQQ